jgi:hypothetical protein
MIRDKGFDERTSMLVKPKVKRLVSFDMAAMKLEHRPSLGLYQLF